MSNKKFQLLMPSPSSQGYGESWNIFNLKVKDTSGDGRHWEMPRFSSELDKCAKIV